MSKKHHINGVGYVAVTDNMDLAAGNTADGSMTMPLQKYPIDSGVTVQSAAKPNTFMGVDVSNFGAGVPLINTTAVQTDLPTADTAATLQPSGQPVPAVPSQTTNKKFPWWLLLVIGGGAFLLFRKKKKVSGISPLTAAGIGLGAAWLISQAKKKTLPVNVQQQTNETPQTGMQTGADSVMQIF